MNPLKLRRITTAGWLGGSLLLASLASTVHAQPTAKSVPLGSTAATRKPPPTPVPPPPAADSTLALVSASAAGAAAEGQPCAISADGSQVLFLSRAANLVSADTNGAVDIFLKNLNGNGIRRVAITASLNPVVCLGMTPDATRLVFIGDLPTGSPNVLGQVPSERAIIVSDIATGTQTRVTPPLATFAAVASYSFAGISDDGLRVAFIAQPTRSCSGYDCSANGPARMLLRDLASGALINLESQVRFTTSQGTADGEAQLSPDGRTLAFSSRAAYPEAGDTTPGSDVFVHDLASGSVRLVSTDAAGRPLTFPGFQGIGPSFGLQAFLANSGGIAFYAGNDTTAGPAGVYVKHLGSGALTRILPTGLTHGVGLHEALSFSDNGRKVAYVESTGNTLTGSAVPRVRDVATGVLINAATLTNGTVGNGRTTVSALLSRQGQAVAFGNNATNLLGAPLANGGAEVRAYRKLLP